MPSINKPTYLFLSHMGFPFEDIVEPVDIVVTALRYDFDKHRAFFTVSCDTGTHPSRILDIDVYEDTQEFECTRNNGFAESDVEVIMDFVRKNFDSWIEQARTEYVIPFPYPNRYRAG